MIRPLSTVCPCQCSSADPLGPPFFSTCTGESRSAPLDSVSSKDAIYVSVEDAKKKHVVSLPGDVASDRQDVATQRCHVERVLGDE